jgi:ABC-type multidrug transport system fused ATPase/permease subunit
VPPTYRERLRIEGFALAVCGLAGTVILLAFAREEATAGPLSSVIQLAIVAVLLLTVAPIFAHRWMHRAVELGSRGEGSAGEPTPLWQLPFIVAGLTVAFGLAVGWDAGLRVTGGCLLVGLAQAGLLERVVAREERRREVRFLRVPGSSLFTGTKLGTVPWPPHS